MTRPDGAVRVARSGGIVRITLDRPAKRNAMTDAMWTALDAELAALDPGGRDRVLVIAGAGGAFCGGSDVTGLLDDPSSLPGRIAVSNRCVLAMHALPIPTIAAVDGVAAGSGANLALACDFVYATPESWFAQLFIRRGLSLDSGASWLMPRLVGERQARRLCLTGEDVPAAEALALGMVTGVVPQGELDRRCAELAERFAAASAPALAGTKRLLNDAWPASLASALGAEADNQLDVIRTDAAHAGINGFGARTRAGGARW